MTEPKTLSGISESVGGFQATSGEVVIERCLNVEQLNPESRYSYCPYCASVEIRNGKPWKNSSFLMLGQRWKYGLRVGNFLKVGYETRYVCPRCRRKLGYEDFKKFWFTDKAKESKLIDISNVDINSPEFIQSF